MSEWRRGASGVSTSGREWEEESVVQLSEKELQTILHSHGVAPGHKSAADQRDEVISLLSRKVQETSDLFESLEMRMNDRERELDNVRHDLHDCEDDLRRAEQEIDRLRSNNKDHRETSELEYEITARDRTIRALEDELAGRDTTNSLMKNMLDEKTNNINLMKVHHQTELTAQGGAFNTALDKRADEIAELRAMLEAREEDEGVAKVARARLLEDICIIFSLEPVRTDADVLGSLRVVQQYIEDRDADLATLVQQNDILSEQHNTDIAELRTLRAQPAQQQQESASELQLLHSKVKAAEDARKELDIETSRELHELRAEKHKLEAQLATAKLVGDADTGGLAEAVYELVTSVSRSGVAPVVHDAPLAIQVRETQAHISNALQELVELRRSRATSRRQKEEIIGVVLEDPLLQELGWDSESEPDTDDLSDHPASGLRWAHTRVRVRSMVDRLTRREAEVGKLRSACQTLHEESTQGRGLEGSGPYLGLVAESSRACDDTGPGVRLVEVRKYTAADRAGLKQGDRLLELGGRSVACAYDLDRVLSSLCPGDTVDVTYVRGKSTRSSMLVVDPLEKEGRRRRKKMARSEIQARVGTSVGPSEVGSGGRRRHH